VIPAPEPLLIRVHPLLSFTSSSEHNSFFTRPSPVGLGHLSWGFAPLRDTSLWSPLTASLPRPAYCSAHSVSHALDGLLLHSPRGLVSSHNHVQDLHFKGFPRYSAATSFNAPSPRVVIEILLLTGDPASARFSRPPTGFSSEQRSVANTKWVRPSPARSLLVLSPPRAFLRTPCPCLHRVSTHDLLNQRLTVILVMGLQRISECST
jgi:hypothetical protein